MRAPLYHLNMEEDCSVFILPLQLLCLFSVMTIDLSLAEGKVCRAAPGLTAKLTIGGTEKE